MRLPDLDLHLRPAFDLRLLSPADDDRNSAWGRDIFALAIAIQNLLNGIGQPFAGAIADRFGTVRALIAGAILYSVGLVLMSYSTTPGMLISLPVC